MTTPNGAGSPPPGGRSYEQVYELATITPPAQANPDLWNNAETARSRFNLNILSGFLSIGAAIGQALTDLASALFGNYTGNNQALLVISDGMTALNDRVELLDDVPGYAGAVMSHNHRFGSGSSWKTIPFNTRYGPEKKASLDVSTSRMVMERGSWSAHFTISSMSGSAGGVGHGVRALVRDKDGTEVLTRIFDYQQSGGAAWSQHYSMPIIVPPDTAPWSVELAYRHSIGLGWWSLAGGTEKTLIWVERKNIDTTNSNIIKNPPNGGDIS